MDLDFLFSVLNNIENAKRDNRKKASDIVLANPNLFKHLISLTFRVNDNISVKSAWVLEWICTRHGITYILPYLNEFTENISKVHFDSALRPCAKICEYLAIAYTSKKENNVKVFLTEKHIERIIETGFDWLITEQKIAVKAYTMQTLYLFGLQIDWIHSELEHIIKTKVIHQSKGTEARGKKILELIKKHRVSN